MSQEGIVEQVATNSLLAMLPFNENPITGMGLRSLYNRETPIFWDTWGMPVCTSEEKFAKIFKS